MPHDEAPLDALLDLAEATWPPVVSRRTLATFLDCTLAHARALERRGLLPPSVALGYRSKAYPKAELLAALRRLLKGGAA